MRYAVGLIYAILDLAVSIIVAFIIDQVVANILHFERNAIIGLRIILAVFIFITTVNNYITYTKNGKGKQD